MQEKYVINYIIFNQRFIMNKKKDKIFINNLCLKTNI